VEALAVVVVGEWVVLEWGVVVAGVAMSGGSFFFFVFFA
jgi:hypothetical protein